MNAPYERGHEMSIEAAWSTLRDANDWLKERLMSGADCACGSCYLCAYLRLQREFANLEAENARLQARVRELEFWWNTTETERDRYKALDKLRGEALFPDGCLHGLDKERHSFSWGDGPRNIWNPMQPKCVECGRSVGELLRQLAEAQGKLDWDRWLIAMLVATEYTQHARGCPRLWNKECECWMAQVFTAAEARASAQGKRISSSV